MEKVWKMLKTQVFNNSQTKNRSQKAKTVSEKDLSLIFFADFCVFGVALALIIKYNLICMQF